MDNFKVNSNAGSFSLLRLVLCSPIETKANLMAGTKFWSDNVIVHQMLRTVGTVQHYNVWCSFELIKLNRKY